MSYISESKTVTINVNFKGQIIEGIHTISYYDSPSIDVAEIEFVNLLFNLYPCQG